MNYKITFTEQESKRVDIFIADYLEDVSRSQVKKMFQEELIFVNSQKVKPSYRLKEGDLIEFSLPARRDQLEPIDLNLKIIYEDEDLLIVDKPQGLIVHPAISSDEVSLVNHLLFHTTKLAKQADSERPGIVHRLDKDTSGLLVVAKTDFAYSSLVSQFQQRSVKRLYRALVHRPFKELSGTIDAPLKRDQLKKVKMAVDPTGKIAITHFKVLAQNDLYSYLECQLETGRTHQIRVHLSYIGHPIVGDQTYGKKKEKIAKTQILHAKTLGFIHPRTGKKISFETEIPSSFDEALKKSKLK